MDASSSPVPARLIAACSDQAVLPPLLVPLDAGAQSDCGTPGTMTVKTADTTGTTKTATRVFADGSVAVRARLAVNPDGVRRPTPPVTRALPTSPTAWTGGPAARLLAARLAAVAPTS